MERFRDFVKVVATLSREEFLEHFPHPLLLFYKRTGSLDDLMHTRLMESIEGSEGIDRFTRQVLDFAPLLPNPRTGKEFPNKAFIGRDEKRDFVVKHSTVSKRHACLFFDPGQSVWKLVDSGSTNGTLVSGQELRPGEPRTLQDADVITFGEVDFLFFSPKGAYRYMSQYLKFRDAMR